VAIIALVNARIGRAPQDLRPGGVRMLVLLVLSVVLVGCSAAPSAEANVAQLREQPFGDSTVEAAMNVLAGSGVATFDDADSDQPLKAVTDPASPLVLMRDQVRAMALEANAGGGIPGDEIDALVEIDETLAPPSYILAGYVAEAETDGAEFARQLMGEQDWSQAPLVVFPQLVLVLFTADVVRERMAEVAAGNGQRMPWAAGNQGVGPAMAMANHVVPVPQKPTNVAQGPCSSVQNFIDNALRRVFDALRLGESGGIGGFFAKIWNFVVNTLEKVITALVKAVTQPVLDLIAKVAAVVGMVSVVISAVRPWTVTVNPDPPVTEKGTNARPPDHGALITRVHTGGIEEWPAWAEDCARTAGQPLPSLKPEGAPIQWEPVLQSPLDLASEDSHEVQLDAAAMARLDYTTLIDPIDEPYDTHAGMIWTRVTLERQEIKQLANIVETQLLSALPGFVVDAIYAPLLKPAVDSIMARLSRLLTVSAWGKATVLFHVQREPTPPPPTPTPTAPPTPRPVPPPGGGGGGDVSQGCDNSCSGSNGDPHLTTVDGHLYDFQAAGEFTLLRSADGRFEVQARQQAFEDSTFVSINTAVAVGYDGHRVGLYSSGGNLRLLVDGLEAPIETAASAGALQVRPLLDGLEVHVPEVTTVWLLDAGAHGINLLIAPSDALDTTGVGLLGPVGAAALPALPDGSRVDTTDRYRAAVYEDLAAGWEVTTSTSLFDYESGQGPATYRDPSLPEPEAPLDFSDLPVDQQQLGLEACATVQDEALREQCAFDFVVTNDAGFIDAYLATESFALVLGGDACGLLSNEQILEVTDSPVLSAMAGAELGRAICTWDLDSGPEYDDPWQVVLDVYAEGGRDEFEKAQEFCDGRLIPDLGDRAMRGCFGDYIMVLKGDMMIVVEYRSLFVGERLEGLTRAVMDRFLSIAR
jgi:hypothetical protein